MDSLSGYSIGLSAEALTAVEDLDSTTVGPPARSHNEPGQGLCRDCQWA